MNIIEIMCLKKIYKDNICALNSISLSIKKGEFFALLGKNGAGKSTAIGILISLISKTYGKVFISGYDLDVDAMKIKALIGFVPQEYNFCCFETVLDIIINQAGFYGIKRSIAFDRAKYLLLKFDLWDKRYTVSMRLSGGMKRRLMIVRALIHKPNILVLDEPTAGVDILSRRLIWKFLKNMNDSGITIILTTHYLEEVEYLCNGVAIIDDGNILIRTTVNKLLEKVNRQVLLLNIKSCGIDCSRLQLEGYRIFSVNNDTLEVIVSKGKTFNDLFIFLMKKGIQIYDIKSKYNKLEELFVELVS